MNEAVKKDTALDGVIKGETSTGFSFSIPRQNLDNMDLLDAISEMGDSNPLAFSKVINLMLGKDQKKKLYDHVRTDDGRVPVEKLSTEIQEIFEASNETKN
jgi:hypothetical protein